MSRRRSREETAEEVPTNENTSGSRENDANEPSARRSARESTSRRIVDGADADNDDEIEVGDDHVSDIFQFAMERRYIEDHILPEEGTKSDMNKWNKLSLDAQELCIKTIARLFILKGSKNEVITSTHIGDALGALDNTYKSVKNPVLSRVQDKLRRSFGYVLVSSDCIIGCGKTGTNKDFFLTTNLTSRKLWMELTKINKDSGYHGFLHVVFQCIFMSKGKRIVCKELLGNLRQLDPRFPSTLVKSSGSKTIIPELGDDFLGLLGRMKKEKYIEEVKARDAVTVNDPLEVVYTFGSRFHLELGTVQLAKAMFTFNNEPIDAEFIATLNAEQEEDMEEDE